MESFSVVIPLHNAAPYIRATLTSLAAQLVLPDEVIVVDDGSTDGSGDIARDFRFPDGSSPRVLRHEIPMGVAASRNHGVFASTCDWIGLCDNDDLWHPRRIQTVLEWAAAHPETSAIATDVAGFALEADRTALQGHQRAAMVNHWVPNDSIETLTDRVHVSAVAAIRQVTFADLQRDTCFATTVVCLRRERYITAGGCATWTAPLGDWLLHASVALMEPIPVLESPLVFYRVRPASQSHEDATIAWSTLGILLALRLSGEEPDRRAAGGIYRHMVDVGAHDGFPVGQTLALAVLGGAGTRELAGLTKAAVKSRFARARPNVSPPSANLP